MTITQTEITRAVSILNKSERGLAAMRDSLAMLDNGGISLDQSGQVALITLITAAFTSHPGAARDAMREAVETRCEHGVRDGDYCEPCNKEYKRAAVKHGLD